MIKIFRVLQSAIKRKQKKSIDTDDWLADIVCTGVKEADNATAAEIELNRYLVRWLVGCFADCRRFSNLSAIPRLGSRR